MQYTEANEEERVRIDEMTEQWIESRKPLFNQVEPTVKAAVSEFIANNNGLTLFKEGSKCQ